MVSDPNIEYMSKMSNFELSDELRYLLQNQGGLNNFEHQQLQMNISQLLAQYQQISNKPMESTINEKLNISSLRKKTIDLYEGVISLGYSLVAMDLVEQALFESDSLSVSYSTDLLALLYSIHAVTCQALGQEQQGFLAFQKAKNCLANCFDSWNNILVANTYCHLCMYCSSKGDSDTARFYLNFVDFYFGNRHKLDFERLEEYVIDGSESTGSLRDFLLKNAENESVRNAMSNLGINSSEFLNQPIKLSSNRHIYEKVSKEADFKLLKFRILCGLSLDACGNDQYPVMIKIDPPALGSSNSRTGYESSNDLSVVGKLSPQGTLHLTSNTDLNKLESSNFKGYLFGSYFCKLIADMHLYITGRIPKNVLHMLTSITPTIDNVNAYMEIIDDLAKIYREHEKKRSFNSLQLPLALCIFNLFVFGTKLSLLKEVYRKIKNSMTNSGSPTHNPNMKNVIDFLHSEILKLSNVVTKCTKIEHFEYLKPNLMNTVANASEIHLEILETLSELDTNQNINMFDGLELNYYASTTYSGQDLQNPFNRAQIVSQFEQQMFDMIDLNINALSVWRGRYGIEKYTYMIERMEQLKQNRANQLFDKIHQMHLPPQVAEPFNVGTMTNNNMGCTSETDVELSKLATYLLAEFERQK